MSLNLSNNRILNCSSRATRTIKAEFVWLCLFLLSSPLWGQNLVENPGFESRTDCNSLVIDTPQVPLRTPGWWTATNAHATHYVDCNRPLHGSFYYPGIWWDNPHSGQGYATFGKAIMDSLNIDSRAFLQTKLKEKLKAGCSYLIEINVQAWGRRRILPGTFRWPVFSKDLGIVLTSSPISDRGGYDQLLGHKPVFKANRYITDTTHYTTLTQTITASGGEEFLTIGFFEPADSMTFQYTDGTLGIGCNLLYYIDDLSVELVNPPHFHFSLPGDTALCQGDTLILNTGFPNYQTSWSDGSTGPQISITQGGKYWVNIDDHCVKFKDSIYVSFLQLPDFDSKVLDTAICKGESLSIELPEDFSYQWADGADGRTRILIEPGTYSVVASNQCGSSSPHIIHLTEEECHIQFFIPDAFTPNGDGLNEVFKGWMPGANSFSLKIYNRWGQIIFAKQDNGNSIEWDGKINGRTIPQGSYFYKITAKNAIREKEQAGIVNVIY